MKFRTKCLIAAALLVGATACNNDLTNINQNPNGPVNVPAPSLLSQIIQNATSGFHGVTYNDINAAGLWIQYYAELQYRDEDKYIIRPGTTGGWGFYSGSLENSQRMIDQGVSTSTPNWAAVGRIMKSYIFSELTDAMGDLPYSQALQGASGNLTPAYDTQQQIYTGLFKDLTSADSEINPALIGFSTGDLMYSGDMTEWAKFAASLRLRLAIHLSNRDPATGKAQALAAMAAGVFQSNNDNAQLMYLASSPNQNPVYTNVHVDGRDDFGLSKTLVDSMLSWNDPRLPVYAQLNKDAVPKYEGLPNGLNDGAGPPIASISRIGAMWRETPAAPLPGLTTPTATPSPAPAITRAATESPAGYPVIFARLQRLLFPEAAGATFPEGTTR
jgi:hypothetical protein